MRAQVVVRQPHRRIERLRPSRQLEVAEQAAAGHPRIVGGAAEHEIQRFGPASGRPPREEAVAWSPLDRRWAC